METVPQCRDCPAPARRSHAPARADPNAGPGCPPPGKPPMPQRPPGVSAGLCPIALCRQA